MINTELHGQRVQLLPMSLAHVDALLAAVREGREAYRFTRVPEDEPSMRAYVSDAIGARERAESLPFTVTGSDGRVLGATRFGHFERWSWPAEHPERRADGFVDALEIGWTWYAVSAFRTGANREAKLLMLTHAFETWRVRRVSLRTDVRNERSRRAIEALGAVYEGTSRAAKLANDGAIRDSANYSILDREWPAVKASLLERVTRQA